MQIGITIDKLPKERIILIGYVRSLRTRVHSWRTIFVDGQMGVLFMALIVKKFGGTSVSSKERREQVLAKIIQEKDQGNDVVVVVSAMGRRGDPYATDTFLDLLNEAAPKPSLRTKDLLAACGETISACIVAQELEAKGYAALPITGLQAGICTDSSFTNGLVKGVNSDYLKKVVRGGTIAVVTGFQGYSPDLDLVTLGRGGSDITAIALGGALEADEVEIYTDVPGIAFTDPRLIPSAPFLSAIDFEPMYILAQAGAKVIHPRAVSTAINFNRPFWVRSTFSDEGGTLIGAKGEAPGGLYGMALMNNMIMASIFEDDPGESLRSFSCNEWFYRRGAHRTSVVLEAEKEKDLPVECIIKEVSLITLQWAEDSGIDAAVVAQALDAHNIIREAYFEVPGGGAWAVAPHKAKEAILALYRAPLQKT